MYKSPIELLIEDFDKKIVKKQDADIYQAVLSCGVNVDKDELIRALEYDRGQYEKGFHDGVASIVRCKDCKHWHEETGWCYHHSHFIGPDGEACHPWESSSWKMLNEDDFCSYGERKDNDAEKL